MTRRLLFFSVAALLLTWQQAKAQTNQWTWMSGANTGNHNGTYGTKGIADPANVPGVRHHSASWTSNNGNLWLFGGYGYPASASPTGHLNDLWKYDASTGEWTWMSGESTSNQNGTYGTKGVAGAANVPGARRGSLSWTDNNGDFWLFGGQGYAASGGADYLNDLWKYDVSTGEWTWMGGDSTTNQNGTYGTKGVAATSNIPGARYYAIGHTDNNGDLWLFGGYGYPASGGFNSLNDLWKYNVSTGGWTWVSGSDAANQSGTYGTKGVADPANVPGARRNSTSWTDNNGDLWLFGGQGYASSGTGYLNDLWRYDMAAGEWAWMSGSDATGQTGTYGTRGVADPANVPGARQNSMSWTPNGRDLWLFGGIGHAGGFSNLNDLWHYDVTTTWGGASWSNGTPASGVDAAIGSDVEYGSFSCRSLTINPGFSLMVNPGNIVTVTGDVVNNGNGFAGSGTVSFDNNGSTLGLTGNAISFEGMISVEGTTTLQTNGLLTLTASSDSTYGMLLGDGIVSGSVVSQAWLDLPGGSNDGRYFNLGSPFTNALLSDFNEGANIMVSDNSSQGTAWEWDASTAEWAPAGAGNLSSAAVNGRGYSIYAGTNSYGTFLRDSAGTIELSGSVTNSDVSVSLDYNDGQASSVTFVGGTTIDDTEGWNFVANPYPAQYDWNNPAVPADLSTAKYVWNGLSYEVYNNGAGSGDQYIPPYQGFFVQLTSDPGSSVNLVFDAAKRTSGQDIHLKSATAVLIDGIDLHVYGQNAYAHDEFFVGFDNNATVGFDNRYDARKLRNDPRVPDFYVALGATRYAICRVPLSGPWSFPLKLDYQNHGETMTIGADLNRLKSFATVTLEDRKTKTLHDLYLSSYTFTHDTAYGPGRFVLHFSQNTVGMEKPAAEPEVYAWSYDNGLVVETGTLEGTSVEVFNTSGQVIASTRGSGALRIPLHQKGIFLVRVSEGSFSHTLKVIY